MTCREFVNFLDDYIDGQQSAEMRSRFEQHLALCPHCVAYLKTYRDTIRLGKAAFADLDRLVPAQVPEGLVKAILSATRPDT